MLVNSSSFPAVLKKNLDKWIMDGPDRPPEYQNFFDKDTDPQLIKQYQESYGTGEFGYTQEGGVFNPDTAGQGPKTELTAIKYTNSVDVTREIIKYDRWGIVKKRVSSFKQGCSQTQDQLAATVLNQSTNAAIAGSDGQPLVSLNHVVIKDGSTTANRPTSPASLSETSLDSDRIAIDGMLNSSGLKISARLQKLAVPIELTTFAEKLINTDKVIGSNNNDINPFARSRGRIPGGLQELTYLTSPTQYYYRTNIEGLVAQMPEDLSTDMDEAKRNQTYTYLAWFMVVFGWYDWRSVFSNGMVS